MTSFFIARDNACTGRCRQGRDCTCMHQRNGGQRIDTDLMLASGAIEGPCRRTRPLTVSLWQRIKRAVSSFAAKHLMDPVIRD